MTRSLFTRLRRLFWAWTHNSLLASAVVAAFWLASSSPARAAQQVLKGHVPPITKRLTPIGRLESGARLDLAIGLPLRNREKLTNLLQELYQPSNANFRHYLTAGSVRLLLWPQPGGLPGGD